MFLESSYIHFRTEEKNGNWLEVMFLQENGELTSGIRIYFKAKDEYKLLNCMEDSRKFDKEVPPGLHNIWSVEKAGHRIMVSSSGVKVLDVTVNSDICNSDYTSWGLAVSGMKLDRNRKGKTAYFFIGYS